MPFGTGYPRPRTADFALGLANLPALTRSEIQAGIETQSKQLADRLLIVREKKQNDLRLAGSLAPHVEALFSYSEAQIKAELEWLTGFLESGLLDTKGEKNE
ncbi:MAG: hypothetical protein WCP19_13105 [Chloroflexota bacterium]